MRNHFLRAAVGNAPTYVTDNLVFHIDAGNLNSYDSEDSATTVNSLVGSISSSSYDSNISHSSSDGGYWTFKSIEVAGNNNDTGTGIEFNSITSFMPLGSNDITFECWMKRTGGNFNGPYSIYRTLTNGNEKAGFLKLIYQNQMFFGKDNATSPDTGYADYISSSNTAVSTNTWQHIVASHDTSAGELRIYVDGTWNNLYFNVDTANWSSYHNNATDSYILRVGYGNSGYIMNGDISIVRFYKGKALSSTEVTQNYNAEKARYGY